MRLIDADALEDVLVNHGSYYCNESVYSDGVVDGFHLAIEDLKETPTIDAEPVKHGKWIYHEACEGAGFGFYECSACGRYLKAPVSFDFSRYKYCSICGARMVNDDSK